jgi:hypothetical protein
VVKAGLQLLRVLAAGSRRHKVLLAEAGARTLAAEAQVRSSPLEDEIARNVGESQSLPWFLS